MPIESEKFFKVPNGIFEFSLKPSEFMVYCCLCKFRNNKTNSCFPSRKTVAELCGVSVKTVDAALKKLCALGLVQKRKRQGRKDNFYSNEYTISLCPAVNSKQQHDPEIVCEEIPTGQGVTVKFSPGSS